MFKIFLIISVLSLIVLLSNRISAFIGTSYLSVSGKCVTSLNDWIYAYDQKRYCARVYNYDTSTQIKVYQDIRKTSQVNWRKNQVTLCGI